MLYTTTPSLIEHLKKTTHYRTVSKTNRVQEYWFNRNEVSPTKDYHKIQYLTGDKHSDRIVSEWTSLYDFHNIPF